MKMAKMAGKNPSLILFSSLLGALVLQNQACSLEKEALPFSNTTKEELVNDVYTYVVLPQIDEVQQEIESLEQSLEALFGDSINADLRLVVQNDWQSLMTEWQIMEAMQIGSFASSLDSELGEDIRDEIYSWPTVNPCRIDQETVLNNWGGESFFSDNLVNIYGLDAMEHLLFSDLNTLCPSQVPPVSDGSWDALGDNGIQENQAEYALALLRKISEHLQIQKDTISSQKDEFSVEQLFQDQFTALFYLETMTKDRKIGHILGGQDCSYELCLEDVEGVLSDKSLIWLQSNLLGFRALFTANDGLGFDQVLIDSGYENISIEVLEQLNSLDLQLTELVEEYDGSLVQAVEADPERVEQVYEDLSVITGFLRVEMAAIFQLEIPIEVAGDND